MRLTQQKSAQKLIKLKIKKNREEKNCHTEKREREKIAIAHECEVLMTMAI